MSAGTWLLVLADAGMVLYVLAVMAGCRRRERELRDQAAVNDGWAAALSRRETEQRRREQALRYAEWRGR